MIDWKPYLESICKKYAQWWAIYTITDVVGKNYNKQVEKSLLFNLQASVIQPDALEPEREQFPKVREEKEILNVLEGLRKYAPEHVLLIGRPGSGKSTALLRLLLEEAQVFGDKENDEAISKTNGKSQLPVLVELRYHDTSILDLIEAFINRHHPSLAIDSETVKTLLRQGQFLLLVDGVNELPSQKARSQLQKFHQDYQQTTPMVFTTRDLGVGGDLGINKKLEMQSLTEAQMREFVQGYLPETGEQMLQQLGRRLREFGETPLLLMMLCSVFDSSGNKIPPNLGSMFRRFTEIFDSQLKQDIPVSDDSRRWWKRLLQHLAWVMMGGNVPRGVSFDTTMTEFLVAIPRQQVEEIFTKFLKVKVNCAADCAIAWLDDLLKYHLIQIGVENKIEFRHQLIQEYYAAEELLQEVEDLSDDKLQWNHFNYLKWTESAALMMALLDNERLVLRVVKLALRVDWQLGARLAGEVKLEWQKQTIGLVYSLNVPLLLKIKLLSKTKSDAAIPRLIKLLEDEDSFVRSSAASALGQIKSDAAIPGLIKLLKDEYSSVGSSAASALEQIPSDAAIPGLIELLDDEFSSMGSSVASALGQRKSNVITKLIKLLKDKYSSVGSSAASALGQRKSDAAIPGLIELLEDEDSFVRSSAASALGQIKSDAAIPGLIKLLEQKDSSVRSSAAHALGQIKSDAAIPGLIKLLEDEDSFVRSSAASALGEIKSDTARPGLIKLLEDKNLFVRSSAVDALLQIKSDAVIPGLIELFEDEDKNVRLFATYALLQIKSDAAIPRLIELLEDEDENVRLFAIYALLQIKSDAVIPKLITLLRDKKLSLCSNALGQIKSDAAIPRLIELLEDKDSFVRESAASALGQIKSEAVMISLVKLLNNQHFLQANKGKYSSEVLDTLENIQEHLKYYQPVPLLTMPKILSHNYALLIGVGECEEYKLSLPVTVKDIQALKTLLTDQNLCGYIDNDQHLRLLHDATATSENILDGLNWLKQQAEKDPEATILIYYSGHGCLDESGDYYLIPHETDRVHIANTALPATKFNDALQQILAQRLLVIIDSCHAQAMASSKEGANNRPTLPKGFIQTAFPKNIIDALTKDINKQGTGKVVFTSSTGNQLSWVRPDGEMSVYTYHFLEALQGAANQPGDKVVRVSHLMNYLGKTVPESARDLRKAEQTPFFDFATEDFPVALLRGGKGLATEVWNKQEAEEKIREISNNLPVSNSNVGNIINVIGDGTKIGDISSNKGK